MTPTVFGPDALRDDVVADFAARGLVARVVVGTWETQRLNDADLVVIGFGRGSYENPADTTRATDQWIDLGDGTVARSILARAQTFRVWAHALAPDGTAQEHTEQTAREASIALADAAASAIARTRYGLPLLPWPVEVEPEESGEFVYGSVFRFEPKIATPVFDDPSPFVQADEITLSAQLSLDGTATPTTAETSTEETDP